MDSRTPVLVGVGVAGQSSAIAGDGLEALELMVAAAFAAAEDSGAPGLLDDVDHIAIPRGTWAYSNPGSLIAERCGAPTARTTLIAAGIPQQTLLNDAYRAVISGQDEMVLIVGGEAAGRAKLARQAGVALDDIVQTDSAPDELRLPQGEIVSAAEIDAGVYSAVVAYALIDSALRFAEGRTLDEHRDEIAALWAGFSKVAEGFAHAAFQQATSAATIRESGRENPAMAFPYNKLHCAQMNVDQAAAIIVCSLGAARRLGVDPQRVVFPTVALESSNSVAVPRRRDIHRWPAMQVLGAAAEAHLGCSLNEIDHLELYSCFPAAVRVQQRELGIDIARVPTITGGEPFAGGPWNNFVLQATAAMVERVRREPGSQGLVSTVSGFLHKPGLAVYSTEPGPSLLVADLVDQAAAATPFVPVIQNFQGIAVIAACTVSYDRAGQAKTVVIADTPGGERCVATSDDESIAAEAVSRELIGSQIQVTATTFVRPSDRVRSRGW